MWKAPKSFYDFAVTHRVVELAIEQFALRFRYAFREFFVKRDRTMLILQQLRVFNWQIEEHALYRPEHAIGTAIQPGFAPVSCQRVISERTRRIALHVP